MLLVTPEEMQRLDSLTIEELGLPGMVLMETAGRGVARCLSERWPELKERGAVIVCGPGNNGGDGFVAARWLDHWGWPVRLFLLVEPGRYRGDAGANLALVQQLGMEPVDLSGGDLSPLAQALRHGGVVVDAIFGTGLSRHVEGRFAEAIRLINSSGLPVAAVDIPSGLSGLSGRPLGEAVRADLTVTMAYPKVGHVLYPGRELTGRLEVWDIGIPDPRRLGEEVRRLFLDDAEARRLIRPRPAAGHKGTFGHLLAVAGSRGKSGAAELLALGALGAGAGLVTVASPAPVQEALAVKLTEAMTEPLPHDKGEVSPTAAEVVERLLARKKAVAVGPGLGTGPGAADLVRWLVSNCALPVVADADALNCLSTDPSILSASVSPWVLTPHPGEMARLTGATVEEIQADRLSAAASLASSTKAVVVLKGADTVIASPGGRTAVNGSGNSGMGSGGMGDVLTGVIGALLAQGYPPFEAACLGVFVHGHAADLLAAAKGPWGYVASDVARWLPRSWAVLTGGSG